MKNAMITPVILAGGKGTRLWPLSRAELPKQFCKINHEPSLFQQTIERLCKRHEFTGPVILTNTKYQSLVQTQLHEIECEAKAILCEPCGRDTAAAIALAALCGKRNKSEILLVLPSDHKVLDGDSFVAAAMDAAEIVAASEKIITFGIEPTAPATGYGYLQAGSRTSGLRGYEVSKFIEKPNLEKAKQLIARDDVFWNAGIFMFSPKVMYDELALHAPGVLENVEMALNLAGKNEKIIYPDPAAFARAEAISIDYAVMEKTTKAALVPVDPQWSDVGSWGAVWKISGHDETGNAVVGNALCVETRDCYLSSDGPLIGAAGVSDIVVVANRDAVLVTSRDNSESVKPLMQALENSHADIARQHPGETRPWGSFTSLDKGENHQVKTITVAPGGQLSLQYHYHRAEHWVVVRGVATVTVDDGVMQLGPCQQVFIPQGAVHRLENLTTEPVEIIEVQYGTYLGEDDIVRVEDVYGRPQMETEKTKEKVA